VRTLLLTEDVGNTDVVDGLRLGARGILMKTLDGRMLSRAFTAVNGRSLLVGRDCVGELIENMCAGSPARRATAADLRPHAAAAWTSYRHVTGSDQRRHREQFSITPNTVKYTSPTCSTSSVCRTASSLARFAIEHRLAESVQV